MTTNVQFSDVHIFVRIAIIYIQSHLKVTSSRGSRESTLLDEFHIRSTMGGYQHQEPETESFRNLILEPSANGPTCPEEPESGP